MKRAIDIAPFGELSDPRVVAELAAAAEERGWDGFFVWDHILHRSPEKAIADPWIALAAIACATSTVRIGPMVTPLPRRRAQKLAKETVTLDILSAGRLTLGVGSGSARNGEFEPFGEVEVTERAVDEDPVGDARRHLSAQLVQLTNSGHPHPSSLPGSIPPKIMGIPDRVGHPDPRGLSGDEPARRLAWLTRSESC